MRTHPLTLPHAGASARRARSTRRHRPPASLVRVFARDGAVVLGIDPGLTRCGYAVLRTDGNAVRPVALGVIRTPASAELPQRLAELKGELVALLQQYRPHAVAVEQVFFQTNVRTAMSVGQASGLAWRTTSLQVRRGAVHRTSGGLRPVGRAKGNCRRWRAASGCPPAKPAGGRRRLALTYLACAPMRRRVVGAAMIGSLRGTVLGHEQQAGAAGGRWWLPRHRHPGTLAELEPSSSWRSSRAPPHQGEQTLFGFLVTRKGRSRCSSPPGIGPALALAILGTHGPGALVDIVTSNDLGALTLVPAWARRRQNACWWNCAGRLSLPMLDPVPAGGGHGASVVGGALAGLGYGPEEIRDVARPAGHRRRCQPAARRPEVLGPSA